MKEQKKNRSGRTERQKHKNIYYSAIVALKWRNVKWKM